ncbi:MAG: LamG-like jellyroll fold domain-containing protein, partial [Bacteroidia bacterium]
MKSPNPKQSEIRFENQQNVEQFKLKLSLQNSAIQKLTKLMSKTTKVLVCLIMVLNGFEAFSQSATMTWEHGASTANAEGVYGTLGLNHKDFSPGSRYGATIAKDNNGNIWLFGGYGNDLWGQGYLNDLWKWDGQNWTWIAGNKSKNIKGSYGSKGVASSNNLPGARNQAVSWIDDNGHFWLFGGYGYDNSNAGYLNDLWKWDGNNWTWISGSNAVNSKGVYGTKLTTSSRPVPGARYGSVPFKDSDNNLWLFGGYSYDNSTSGYLNDLWKWDGSEWTWTSGDSTINNGGNYGIKNQSASSNLPKSRRNASGWVDSDDNFWVFGGYKYYNSSGGYLNDLWKWDGTNWTWISGSSAVNSYGIYNLKNYTNSSSTPGARYNSTISINSNGTVYLFGGYGRANAKTGYLNDLWKWDGNNWTWISGRKTIYQSSKLGSKGSYSSSNHPGSLSNMVSWFDSNNIFYLFGGNGYRDSSYTYLTYCHNGLFSYLCSKTANVVKYNRDPNFLMKFNGSQWAWVAGKSGNHISGDYDLKGGPSMRAPGARKSIASCQENDETLWIYGGLGYDKNGDEGHLNDLWKRDPSTGYWTWINGSDEKDMVAVYGTKGTAASANTPGKREDALLWSDGNDLWLFGGKYEDSGTDYYLNDLWKWNGSKWTWISGSSSTNSSGVYSGALTPGARTGSSRWVDASGNLWLYGGRGYDKNGDLGRLSDLWKFDGTSWTFVKGSDLKNAACVYGSKGISASTNMPGSRSGSSYWKDADGNFWFFGGDGHDASGSYGSFNDVWKWDGTNWTWMYGSSTRNELGEYGTQHVASTNNLPGARKASTVWQDENGFLWLFGGYGYGESGSQGRLNDFWMHNGTNWIWIKGSKTTAANANYNTVNTTDYASIIGARSSHISYVVNNNAYVFGGASIDENGNTGSFNDTWRIDIDYAIEHGKDNSITLHGLALTSNENNGNALQDEGDKLEITNVLGTLSQSTNDLPSSTNVAQRFNKTWTLAKTDANNNGGSLDITIDLDQAQNPDLSYYLLARNGTSGDFAVVNNVNYTFNGNQIIFNTDLDALGANDQITIGYSGIGSGYALDFDGTNDKVDLNSLTFNPITSGGFTIELWFNVSNYSNNPSLVSQQNGSGTGRTFIAIASNGLLKCNINGAGIQSTNTVQLNQWNHVVITYLSGEVNMYLNGNLEKTQSETAESATGQWQLGCTKNNSQYFNGQMDEFRLWAGIRTSFELEKHRFKSLLGSESGLLAYYKFDQSEEGYLPDVSSNNNQGNLRGFTLTGTSSNWVNSESPVIDKANSLKLVGPGNALEFDGLNDYVSTTLDVQPSTLATTTWEGWVYPSRLNYGSYQAIFTNDDGGYDRFLMIKSNSNKFIVSKGNGFFEPDYEITANEWIHVAVVYKSDNILLYVNGIRFEHGSAETATSSTVYFSLGGNPNASYDFKGKIDDVRVWNDERTQTEIQDNMYATLNGDESGLIAYYDFNETTGSSLPDLTSNSNNGTLNNFSGTYWVSAADREPFKTIKAGSHTSSATWKGGTAPSSSTDKLAVFHDLTLSSTASNTYSRLQVNSGKTITSIADINITGDVIVNGTATGVNKITLKGSTKQQLGGSGTVGALEIDNSSDISLEGDLTIGGALTLTDGDIELNDHTLTLSGTTSHGSSSSYIKINGDGMVKTTVGSSPVTLPIGRNPYLPIIIDDGGDAEFTVGVSNGVFTNPTNPTTEFTANVVTETWTIQASSAVNDVVVQIGWDAAEEANFTRTNCGIGYWENGVSSSWQKPSSNSAATGSDPYFQTRTMDFSTNLYYLGVGDNSSPLPVDLTYFNAQWLASASLSNPNIETDTEHSRSAVLNWQTAIEENNSHFEVQRSFDGQTWEQVGTVQGQGTTLETTDYQFIDQLETSNQKLTSRDIRGETIYYRLKQIDYNGQFEYSETRTLNFEQETLNSFQVWPNPVSSQNLFLSKKDNYSIINAKGQVVLHAISSDKLDIQRLK